MDKRFYVYEWIDDSGKVFYIGKGTGYRYRKTTGRNRYFTRYLDKHGGKSIIVVDCLDEQTAYRTEEFLIDYYRASGCQLTNLTDGGMYPPALSGSSNGMFGKTHTPETREKISLIHKNNQTFSGSLNSQYDIIPSERMSPEVYESWKDKHRELTGKKNPNYGNRMLSKFYAENPEIAIEKQGRPGIKNGRCVPIRAENIETKEILEFDYIKLCAEYLMKAGFTENRKFATVAFNIKKSLKDNVHRYGHIFAKQN